jgi:hypothetical protein
VKPLKVERDISSFVETSEMTKPETSRTRSYQRIGGGPVLTCLSGEGLGDGVPVGQLRAVDSLVSDKDNVKSTKSLRLFGINIAWGK